MMALMMMMMSLPQNTTAFSPLSLYFSNLFQFAYYYYNYYYYCYYSPIYFTRLVFLSCLISKCLLLVVAY